jgi:plasmid stabilization system protein ParE
MTEINWSPQAREDYNEITELLLSNSYFYAANFHDMIQNAIEKLQKFNSLGRIIPEIGNPRIRELILGKYRLMYFIKSDDKIELIAIVHGSRDLKFSP